MLYCNEESHVKWVEILATDIVKQLFDRYASTDGWKNIFDVSQESKPTCQFCKISFCNERNLKTHVQKFHSQDLPLKCDICEFSTKCQKDLENHKVEKHSGNQGKNEVEQMKIDGDKTTSVLKPNLSIACIICKKSFDTKKEQESHSQDKGLTLKCDVCGIRVENDSCLNEHKQNEHAK